MGKVQGFAEKCPHHELPDWLQIQTFYNGLISGHRAMIDVTAGGSLMRKTLDDAYQLLDDMANNAFNWQSERANRKPAGIHSIDTLSSLSAQMELLNKKMDGLNVMPHHAQDSNYDVNGGEQDMEFQDHSSEQVNFMGNFQGGQNSFQRPTQNQFQNNRGQGQFQRNQVNPQNNPYSATYNPGWRNHPNFSYKNQNALIPPTNGPQAPPQEKKSDLEELLKSYINSNETRLKNQEVSLKHLEN